MPNESRSLWEMYDAETEPWRRGRNILLIIGAVHFLLQCVPLYASLARSDIDRLLSTCVIVVTFWLQFYFVWIGVQWLRWVWGAWTMLVGFWLAICGWSYSIPFEIVAGLASLLMGAFLLSPAVYFFAKHQKERLSWKRALVVGLACLLLLGNVVAISLFVAVVRFQRQREANEFAQSAVSEIFANRDRAWTLAHLSPESKRADNATMVDQFFAAVASKIKGFQQVGSPSTLTATQLEFPFTFQSQSDALVEADTDDTPIRMHFILQNRGDRWEIAGFSWHYATLTPPGGDIRKSERDEFHSR
ncbi:MAG: hypothetical protein M3R59_07265 [Verrucomicrobiota bacterium]|nr:hypothetical protein [Verrucomicrobiota bacterium]